MSAILCDALRQYHTANGTQDDELASVTRLMNAAKKHPLPPNELLAEEKSLTRFGASQAKRLRIGEGDIVRVIHESRARRSAASRRTRQ